MLVTENDMLKVADFGTSRFLEIAAHGTTVIGSPPYMAPEQFHGKAVFASDLYSLGVTMYQMLTGILPYDAPAPADLDRLMSGELVSPPRLKNPAIPKAISDIVMRAMAPDVDRAVSARGRPARGRARGARAGAGAPAGRRLEGRSRRTRDDAQGIQSRLRAREAPAGAVLLAVPQAAARAHRSLPVLRRNAVDAAGRGSRVRGSAASELDRAASREPRAATAMLNCRFQARTAASHVRAPSSRSFRWRFPAPEKSG